MNTATLIAGLFLGVLAVTAPAHARKDDDVASDRRPLPEERRGGERTDQGDVRRSHEADARRLSPDERRDLRRDIRDAGREIYDRDQRRGRGGG